MDRQEFIKSFEAAPGVLSGKKTDEVISACIKRVNALYPDFPEGHFNCVAFMEELGELTAAVSQRMRGRTDNYAILEEIADVLIGIGCVSKICGITEKDICKAINVKLKHEYGKQKNNSENNAYMGGGNGVCA